MLLISRKTLTHDVDKDLSPAMISSRLDGESRETIISIRSRTTDKNEISDMVEFDFSGITFPPAYTFQVFF